MRKHHPENERIKRKYFVFLQEAKRQSESSVDQVAKAISRFEVFTKWKSFKAFHFEQAVAFKAYLARQPNEATGRPLSKATLNSTVRALKTFFQWLAMQPGYKSKVSYTDAEYFNLSEKDARIASAKRLRPVPTLEQVKHVLGRMPADTVVQRRDQAVLAFILLSGVRDSAASSLKLKHVDVEAGYVFQDAREVNTKASKTIASYFFPVGDEVVRIVREWVHYLRQVMMFGNDDPLFPKTQVALGERQVFEAVGISREHWSNATPIRRIFRNAFETAGLDYYNPHSIRNTLAQLGETVCRTPEEFKAWSQNLGHDSVRVTFDSYGEVQPRRQAEILSTLGEANGVRDETDWEKLGVAIARELHKQRRKAS
ncbi:MAG: recombinase XerC [Salinisphaeraceae bacterium]|nr:recombinase XerC [Salinisphaeraceae bacterium]